MGTYVLCATYSRKHAITIIIIIMYHMYTLKINSLFTFTFCLKVNNRLSIIIVLFFLLKTIKKKKKH